MNENLEQLAACYLQILKEKPAKIVSSQEALKDIVPIEWDDDILNGKRKITIYR